MKASRRALRIGWRSAAVVILPASILTAWQLVQSPHTPEPAEPSASRTESKESVPLLSRDQEAGRVLFERACGVCHGRLGDGFGINAPNLPLDVPSLASPEGVGSWDEARLFARIARGGGTAARPPVCPPWQPRLTPREIDAVVAFVRSLSSRARAHLPTEPRP